MAKLALKRISSDSTFGTPVEKKVYAYSSEEETALKVIPKNSSYGSSSQKKRRGRLNCCCGMLLALLVSLITVSGLFLLIELLSRPGFDKASQDTQSNLTRQKIQNTRNRIPEMLSRLKGGNATLTKQELVDYIQLSSAYSAATYTVATAPQNCNNPAWSALVRSLSSKTAKAYVARDDAAQLIVVAFKGISKHRDFLVGLDTRLAALNVSNSSNVPISAQVQAGFQDAYKSIESELLLALDNETGLNGNYSILVTGHNSGGSMAVLAALALKARFPTTLTVCVTQGQGKTFNQAGADHIDREFPVNTYGMIRAVHSLDGIPSVDAPYVNKDARHHSGEVWQFRDPATPENVVVCRGQQDPNCSSSLHIGVAQLFPPALPWSAESLHYFDVEMNSAQSVQCGGPGGQSIYSLLTSRGIVRNLPLENAIANVIRQ